MATLKEQFKNLALKVGFDLHEEDGDFFYAETKMAYELFHEIKANVLPECTWSPDQNEEMWGNWHTSCGGIFTLNEGTPTENRLNHCCYCGGLLIEAQEPNDD